jgi:hypothetical protein
MFGAVFVIGYLIFMVLITRSIFRKKKPKDPVAEAEAQARLAETLKRMEPPPGFYTLLYEVSKVSKRDKR